MFRGIDDPRPWVVRTGSFSGTFTIGVSFVFLAYFLHPAVEKAYQRVRAYRGWRAIEANKTVEVTPYPLVSEIFGGRGRWDAARIVAIIMAAFSLASWGLELQMGLAYIDGFVTDLLLRPPPVWKMGTEGAWHVIRPDKLDIVEGEVPNMDKTFSVGSANARYKVNGEPGIVNGRVRIASWDTDVGNARNKLFYADNGEVAGNVISHECVNDENPVDLYVDGNDESWGTVIDCKNGPQKVNGDSDSTSHVVKLTSKGGIVYFIVEESSTYPSFLYSVWKAENETDGSATLHHVFHISSSVRLAEAVVTEIVHADSDSRVPTGGRSFALLRVFSEKYPSYTMEDRATPFGEQPKVETLEDIPLSTIEYIEKGIELDITALLCAIWLTALTLAGIAWSLRLRSSIEMDIYDRDELIRAVTLAGSANGAEHSSKMRIFVKKEENGKLSVVISDAEVQPNGCVQRCGRKQNVAANDDPIPKSTFPYSCKHDGSVVSSRPQTLWLEGMRMGKGKVYPGRRGNYLYPNSIALIASPVPSPAGSIAGTPIHQPTSSADVPPSIRQFPGVNPALFDSMRVLGDCDEYNDDIEMCTGRSESRETEVLDLREVQFLSERSATLHEPLPDRLTTISSFTTLEAMGSSPADPGEEKKATPNGDNDTEIAETE